MFAHFPAEPACQWVQFNVSPSDGRLSADAAESGGSRLMQSVLALVKELNNTPATALPTC